ncbi:hypothetical protein NP233_g2218 [Leucocoprinus birnbaumii]|uniref:Nephrocystin 3-like N-terminal domain-containing protein n=1 Tax=Leucocoprinus birnbaumii TaxID=56174 RepID=A0AAD5W162_9AGAR|nr:hypothetical protein NP233_g2218 [Leucocoprinus birnbaumii]
MKVTGAFVTLLASLSGALAATHFAGITASNSIGNSGSYTCRTQAQWNTLASDAKNSGFKSIRIEGFDCNALTMASSAAAAQGLTVMAGIYFDGTVAANNGAINDQVNQFISAVKQFGAGRYVGLTVGNESTDSPSNVMNKVSSVRSTLRAAGVNTPVTSVHNWVTVRDNSVYCQGDFVGANAHAFYDPNTPSGQTGNFVIHTVVPALRNVCGSKPLYITESGWASRGNSNGAAVASLADERSALLNLNCACRDDTSVSVYAFEYDDQLWKGNANEQSFELFGLQAVLLFISDRGPYGLSGGLSSTIACYQTMGLDSFIDSLENFGTLFKRHTKHDNRRADQDHRLPSTSVRTKQANQKSQADTSAKESYPQGFFAHASNVVVNNPIMIETFTNNVHRLMWAQVLHHLAPHTNPDAAVDSSARWPPPSCHPGTRITIGNTLMSWVENSGTHDCSMIWLYGSAGCGKSAVAQTFAEKCVSLKRLGAAYFFSRPNKRNDPKTVIPTIAYQLALHCPDYKAVITSRLADDPQLLSKAIPVQFRELIITPFSQLQAHGCQSIRRPFLIVLDGLDECQGEAAQCEFIRLIYELVRVKKNFPLVWLISSRSEAHLQHMFLRITDCGRQQLVIDEECRNDVDRFLRDGLFDLQLKYNIGPSWPSSEQFDAVTEGISGHFVFAATALGFIGDDEYANPPERLDKLVTFFSHARGTHTPNPQALAKLDTLYACILSDVPENVFPTTWRILAHFIYMHEINEYRGVFLYQSAQSLCNFVDIDQATFYGAMRKLYSVVDVPGPEKAGTMPLRFYHASFQDFLVDPSRSGRFAIEEKQAVIDITKSLLFWHEVDAGHFHTTDGPWDERMHDHAPLPGLKWTLGMNPQRLSEEIAAVAGYSSWDGCIKSGFSREILSCVLRIDWRYLELNFDWVTFVDRHYAKDFPSSFCRTNPTSNFDMRLLEYLGMMTNRDTVQPASFPLAWEVPRGRRFREYLLIDYGQKSVVVWFTQHGEENFRIDKLNCDQPPRESQISEYQEWLQDIGWYSEDDAEGFVSLKEHDANS